MATIEKRKSANGDVSYRVKVRLRGHPAASATFSRVTDAKRWAEKTKTEIREGRYFGRREAEQHTFGEMIDRYISDVLPTKEQSSRHSQERQLKWWKERLGDYSLAAVNTPMIAEARDALLGGSTRQGDTRSNSTVVRYLAALSHCYTKAQKEWQWVNDNPVRNVTKPKEPTGRVRFLSDDERARLLVECRRSQNENLYAIVVLALSTGMRRGEIMGVRWPDIDLERGTITLHKTKNGERRAVPIVVEARRILQARSRFRRIDTDMVFPAKRIVSAGEKAKPDKIETAWRNAIERAGIQDFRFHDLRHSAASYLAMNGATLAEIAEVLGHKTLQMVKRYAHMSEAHTSRVLERMNMAIFEDRIDRRESAS